MNVKGLDTNIILRIFDRTNEKQSRAVSQLLQNEGGRKNFALNPIVLSEFAWTLERRYKKSRADVAEYIEDILRAPEFAVTFAEEASEAVRLYRHGPADFADYFMAIINKTLGCSTTLTFDDDAAKSGYFSLLKA